MNPRYRGPEAMWAFSRQLHRNSYRGLARIVKTFNYLLHRALLPAEAIVGKGVTLEHYALGIVIHPQVEIGNECQIYHHVTLASETWIGSPHKIILGNSVVIGAHAIVIARPNRSLLIGDRAMIGAGAVITKDVPPAEVWAGNPARKLRGPGDFASAE